MDRAEVLEEYRAGRNKPDDKDININSHISSKYMRKSFISMMVEMGVQREVIMAFSGHESEKVIQHYIQVHKHTKLQVLDNFKPIRPTLKSESKSSERVPVPLSVNALTA